MKASRVTIWATALLTSMTLVAPATAHAGVEGGEFAYYQGRTVFFVSAGVVIGASPNLLATSPPLYLLNFPVPAGTNAPITLPSGYQPQENGNLRAPYPFHDHVLQSLPGDVGYRAALRVVIMRYTTTYVQSLSFQPVTSVSAIASGEAAGIFQVVAPGTADPYQLWIDDVLMRPVITT